MRQKFYKASAEETSPWSVCPDEILSVIIENGITLTGGTALLRGLAARIEQETGMTVRVADNPLDCVVEGTGKRLEAGHGFDTYVFRRNKNYR